MRQGYLSEYFVGIVSKRLSAVEANQRVSNQHEFNGVNALRTLLGEARQTFNATFIYLNDTEEEPTRDTGFVTWYDAREAHPTRSEYRLYFPTTSVSEKMREGDLLVIGRRPDNSLLFIVAEAGSTFENQIRWLFGLDAPLGDRYQTLTEAQADTIQLTIASRYILEQIGEVIEEENVDFLPRLREQYGNAFPKTKVFSAFARDTLPEITVWDNPDMVIAQWMEREELLFRTFERYLVQDRLRDGFNDDVEAFIQFSLSVQNRRKSRAGHALENHLEYLFAERAIRHSRTARTEGKSKPDFLFPSIEQYHDPTFEAERLTMLGVKTSCKERWRQILAEANRIPGKHLLTLEPGISRDQTDEMVRHNVQLILPQAIHTTYSPEQQAWLMNVEEFVDMVEAKQQEVN